MMAAPTAAQLHKESELADSNWNAFRRGYDGRHETYVTEANRFSGFYCGKQWEEEVEQKLKGEGKPVLTINVAKKAINTILGTYNNSRADVVFKPKKGTTSEQARTVTHLVDHIFSINKYHHIERNIAMDGWIMDRGFVECRVSFDENVLGEVEISDLDPRDVVLDPDAKDYDPSTWSEVTVARWKSLDDIAATWGQDKVDRLRGLINIHGVDSSFGTESIRFGARNEHDQGPAVYVPGHVKAEDERRIRAVRVIDRQYKKMAKVKEFVDLESGDISEVPETWDPQRARQVAEHYGLVLRQRMKPRIRWTVTVDRVVLHDDWSPYDRFTVVPYFPYFVRGNPTGVMRDLISPQEQLNKTESQELHIVNTTANSGWIVEAGSLVNMTEDDLEERGAETGIVIVHSKTGAPPDKIQPNSIPTGIDRISQKSFQYVTEIPGISILAAPQVKSDVSGIAFDRASNNALNTLRVVFDNLDYTRELLAELILEMVQKYYTEARIFRITDWRNPEEPEIDVQINTDVLNNVTTGKYDIVASSAPAQDTQEDREFAQMMEMRAQGVQTIPDYHVVLASNIKNKHRIAEESKQLQGLGEPSPEEAEMAAVMQELQLRGAQTELAKLDAEVQETLSQAGLNAAKAEVAVAAEQREAQDTQAGRQLEVQRLRADVAKAAANLMNKLELAGVHAGNKRELTRYAAQMKALEKHLDRETTIEIAKLRPQQNKETDLSGVTAA